MESVFVSLNKNYSFTLKSAEEKQFVLFVESDINATLEINLAGEQARAEVIAVVLGNNNNQINLQTKQNHLAEFTTSDLLVKSVLTGSANFNFSGLIHIAKEAQVSDAYQRNENLLLSKEAKCNSKPYLEILANNVRCTHGATMGRPDREQLFYLQTRGLSAKQATKLLVDGFFNSLLAKIKDEKCLSQLKTKILAHLYD
ncbi:SufD family Fe-S cluster assembly protein [Candidatus Gottesmanbacteria bacterium]|nr:SufD family Fe-S cluster assembly protein [Candidatus Gottesmanbacteria bacterium]